MKWCWRMEFAEMKSKKQMKKLQKQQRVVSFRWSKIGNMCAF